MPHDNEFQFGRDSDRDILRRIEHKVNRITRRQLNLEMKVERAILHSSEAGKMGSELDATTKELRQAVAENPPPKQNS